MLGEVVQAVAFGRRSYEYSEKSGELLAKRYGYSTLGDALHQIGDIKESKKYLHELERILKKEEPLSRYLYSVDGFKFCDLLLSQGQVEEVLKRANETIKIAIEYHWLLAKALDQLSLGRACLLQASTFSSIPTPRRVSDLNKGKIMKQASNYLTQTVDGLRKAGAQEFIIRGLFARAELYRLQGDYPSAWDDLEEAHDIAERGEMRLWLTDYHLGASRLLISEFGMRNTGTEKKLNRDEKLAQLEMHVEQAKELVNETGYHRRDPELLLLQAQLHFVRGAKENARIWLNKAKKRFDEMGIRMWDFEVHLVEQAIG